MIVAVILAAGAGRRMGGRPKALLLVDGETFLERVARTCREAGAERLVVVTRADPPDIETIARSLGATVVENPAPERGMFSSVQLGIAAASLGAPITENTRLNPVPIPVPYPDALLIFPVDHPRVEPATVSALTDALPHKPAAAWLRPVHGGRGGHPILLDGVTARRLLDRDPGEPLRDALRALGLGPRDVPVDDPGIHANLNRPEDLV